MSIDFGQGLEHGEDNFEREIRHVMSQHREHKKLQQTLSQGYRSQGEAFCGFMPSPRMTIRTMRGVSSVEISTLVEEVKPTPIVKPHGFRNAAMEKVDFWRRVLAILFPLHF